MSVHSTVRADTANIEVVTPDANGKNLVYTFNLDTFMLEGRPESSLPIIRAGATIRIRDLPSIQRIINHNGYVKHQTVLFISLDKLILEVVIALLIISIF